jgi:hypothetical protein
MVSDEEVIRQVEEDRKALSEIAGYEVVGMAYPGGSHVMNEHVADLIRNNTGIKYARTTTSTHNFDLQSDLIIFNPTVYHHVEWDELFRLGEEFIALKPDTPKIFYIWGHAYEFDNEKAPVQWEKFEEILAELEKRNYDIWCATNIEIYDYVQAQKQIRRSADGKTFYNPTDTDVWVAVDDQPLCIGAGKTVTIS